MLVCGLNSIHGEVCKNIVLAGVGALTILDHRVVTEDDDVSAYFLCNTDDCGKFVNGAQVRLFPAVNNG